MAMNAPDGGSAAASPEASVTAEAATAENGAFTARFMKAVRAAMSDHEGYPGVALDVIGGLRGLSGAEAIVNVPNGGAISGMDKDDVVEIPVRLGLSAGTAVQGEKAAQDVPTSPAGTPRNLSPVPIGTIPRHCLGLMLQVKEFEKRTIAAAMERSRQGAVTALALHPLIGDLCTAEKLAAALEREAGPLFSPSAGSPGRTAGR